MCPCVEIVLIQLPLSLFSVSLMRVQLRILENSLEVLHNSFSTHPFLQLG